VTPAPTPSVTSRSSTYLRIIQTSPARSSSLQAQEAAHQWVDNNHTCILSRSGYHVSIDQKGRSPECLAQNYDASLNNVVNRVQMQVVSGKDGGGVFFRVTSTDGYFFTMNASGDYGLWLAGDNRSLQCDPGHCHTSLFRLNQPNILGVL
jgi:hypothetical protein